MGRVPLLRWGTLWQPCLGNKACHTAALVLVLYRLRKVSEDYVIKLKATIRVWLWGYCGNRLCFG